MEEKREMEVIIPKKRPDIWLPHWERYLKKIPKRGLNNLTKVPWWWESHYPDREWRGKPTIEKRLEKITGWLGDIPPFFYYAGDMRTHGIEKENLPKIQELTKQILDRLETLYENMDKVTVLSPQRVTYWKERIRETDLKIRKYSRWIDLDLIHEGEFRVCDENNL
jgi:hypothetical protein